MLQSKVMAVTESLPMQDIARFCPKWGLQLAVFGSALREDFGPESAIDVLATSSDKSEWGLFEHVQIAQELEAALGRKVDLLRSALLPTPEIVFTVRRS